MDVTRHWTLDRNGTYRGPAVDGIAVVEREDRDRWRRQFDMERAKTTRLEHDHRGAVDALIAAPMPERESIHKGDEWAERYGDWWHEHVRPHVTGGQ